MTKLSPSTGPEKYEWSEYDKARLVKAMETIFPKDEAMTKDQILETLKLLSALEAWTFTERHAMPMFLIERMDRVVDVLTKEVLK